MFLLISNVAAPDRVFVPGNLLFADQQSQGTSLRSLRLSILVFFINPPQYDRFPFVFFIFQSTFLAKSFRGQHFFILCRPLVSYCITTGRPSSRRPHPGRVPTPQCAPPQASQRR